MKVKIVCWSLVLFSVLALVSCEKSEESTLEKVSDTLPMQPLALQDLSSFEAVKYNWKIVGKVWSDPQKERDIQTASGNSILVCQPTESAKDNIFSTFEHGDIEIEMDVMVPASSNSGVYLQGRYEVQVFDSWGKDNVIHGDMGGIYQRWDESRGKGKQGYDGVAPRMNAAKAPGLWQHLHIIFHAPRFDAQGNKVKNAFFEKVSLNGVVIHENVELSGPTRAAAFEDEQPLAPLMLQGDHGPVAYRNIRYKLYENKQVAVHEVSVQEFESDNDTIGDFSKKTPVKSLQVDEFSYHHGSGEQNYALVYKGKMRFPTTGNYLFKMQLGLASTRFVLNGDTVIHSYAPTGFQQALVAEKQLEAGEYDFELIYNKPYRRWRKGFAFYVEGPGIQQMPLHAKASTITGQESEPIIVEVQDEVALQRSFVQHGDEKRTHCISVGTPEEIHYAYDLASASLLKFWNGGFLDATDMWHSRGEQQLGVSLGPLVSLHGQPGFSVLSGSNQQWPDTLSENTLVRSMGYELDGKGLPAFLFQMGDLKLRDHLVPSSEERRYKRTLTFQGLAQQHSYFKLAEGSDIFQMEDGSYAINDFHFYLIPHEANEAKLFQRESKGKQELLLDLSRTNNASFSYSIVW